VRTVEEESVVAAQPDAVWARVSTFEGVNDELRPLMRMTAPARVRALDPSRRGRIGVGPETRHMRAIGAHPRACCPCCCG